MLGISPLSRGHGVEGFLSPVWTQQSTNAIFLAITSRSLRGRKINRTWHDIWLDLASPCRTRQGIGVKLRMKKLVVQLLQCWMWIIRLTDAEQIKACHGSAPTDAIDVFDTNRQKPEKNHPWQWNDRFSNSSSSTSSSSSACLSRAGSESRRSSAADTVSGYSRSGWSGMASTRSR